MSASSSSPLAPIVIEASDPGYLSILAWPFDDQPFYEGQIKRLLKHDIPHRLLFSCGSFWIYRDRSGNNVGFAMLELCEEYRAFTGGERHLYIPLLAVHPGFRGIGYGHLIVDHLIHEASQFAASLKEYAVGCSEILFLDVYTANRPAISLYEKHGFSVLNLECPISDPEENNELFVVMARRLIVG